MTPPTDKFIVLLFKR